MRWRPFLPLLLLAAPNPVAAEEVLFNGKDFTGWTYFLEKRDFNADGKARIGDFVKILPGGVLEITPRISGMLMTAKDYRNYRFHTEFRWPTDTPPTKWRNAGLFIKIIAPFEWDAENSLVPRMYEIDVKPLGRNGGPCGCTGDMWILGYHPLRLRSEPSRSYKPLPGGGREPTGTYLGERRHHNIVDAEKPIGEWNTMDVEVQGKDISVWVNGQLVNRATNLVALPGRIGMISEGGDGSMSPIQWRNMRITELADTVAAPVR